MDADDQKIKQKLVEAIQYVLQPPEKSNFLIINRSSDELSGLAELAAIELGLKAKKIDLNSKEPYKSFPENLKKELCSGNYPRAAGFFTYPEGAVFDQTEKPARVELLGYIRDTPMGYAHAPAIDMDMALNGPLQCDYKEKIDISERLMEILKNSRSMHVTSPSGTNLDIQMKTSMEWQTDCNGVPPGPSSKGKIAQFPVGEVFIEKRRQVIKDDRSFSYPIKQNANGTVVCDLCTDGVTRMVDPSKPIRMRFEDGIVRYYYSADKDFNSLSSEWIKREHDYGLPTVLEEIGIGINEAARNTGKLLEVEKKYGTVHFALGNIRYHNDFVVGKPTVNVIRANGRGKTIIQDGKLKL